MSKQIRVTLPDAVYVKVMRDARRARISMAGWMRIAVIRSCQDADFTELDQQGMQDSRGGSLFNRQMVPFSIVRLHAE